MRAESAFRRFPWVAPAFPRLARLPKPPANMVEIEIGVLRGQCLDRRVDEKDRLIAEIAAWEEQRNKASARINWMFTTEPARTKLARAYPDTAKES